MHAAALIAAEQAHAVAHLSRQYLTFQLKGESYAVPIESIKEIIEVASLTAVPMMPSFVRGVMNLRGAVIPVIDLAVHFGVDATVTARRTCIVIFEVQAASGELQTLGVLVDAVNEVLDIAESDVEPAPALGTHIPPDFIRGMAKVRGRLVIALDLERVLSIDELARLAGGTA